MSLPNLPFHCYNNSIRLDDHMQKLTPSRLFVETNKSKEKSNSTFSSVNTINFVDHNNAFSSKSGYSNISSKSNKNAKIPVFLHRNRRRPRQPPLLPRNLFKLYLKFSIWVIFTQKNYVVLFLPPALASFLTIMSAIFFYKPFKTA